MTQRIWDRFGAAAEAVAVALGIARPGIVAPF
jgi:hypothetical protein